MMNFFKNIHSNPLTFLLILMPPLLGLAAAWYIFNTSDFILPMQPEWIVLLSGLLVGGAFSVLLWLLVMEKQNHQHFSRDCQERLLAAEQKQLQLTAQCQLLTDQNAQLQRDLQQHIYLEKLLRTKEERFELAMRGANDGLWDWDLQTNDAYFSPRWKQMLGYSDEELSSHFDEWHQRLHPEEFDKVMLEIDAYLEKKTPCYESLHRMRHKDGHYVWVWVRGLALWNEHGEALRFVGTYVDMTAQKEAEERLKESEQYRRTLIEESLIGLVLADLEGHIQEVNPAYANIVGYTPVELCQFSLWHLVPEKYHPLVQEQLEKVKTTGRLGPVENQCLHQNGHLVPVRWSGLRINFKGQTFIWNHLEDITEQKRMEQAEKGRLEAEIANRAKSAFLANMSHELRTPLNGILGYAQILNRDDSLNNEQREGVHVVLQCGEYLLTLINDILDLSKVETGDLQLYPSDFHFGDFLTHITQLFQLRAKEKGISFIYEPLSRLPVGAHADEKRLRQILVHLLGNAIKFTEKGGVTLQISYQDGNIHFMIEDTGIGIAPADLERIFLPFQQPSKQYNYAKVEGLGVGLPLTKKLVELMGGELQVQSVLGHGSTFSVKVKLMEIVGLIRPVAQPRAILGFEGKPRVLLVVDDHWENRSVVVNLLRPLGFDLIEAADGQEALAIIREVQVDLILTDLVMPVMDGFELARQVRKMSEISHIPIIALSASVLPPQQAESILAGCNICLMKPIRATELLDTLQKYLGITWIYEQSTEWPQGRGKVTDIADLVGPSNEQANVLYQLILTEELRQVVEATGKMEQENPQLTPFANLVRDLAKEFHEEQICELIERFL